jgi:hypothetical protein
MCLLKVKEEPYYSEPVRVKEVRRTRRAYSPERVRTARYSNTRVVEERRPPSYNLPPPQSIPPPPAPPSYSAGPPPDPPAPPPAPPTVNSEHVSIKKTESRRTSRPASLHQSTVIVEPEPLQSSVQIPTHASYVEVSHEAESPPSSSPSSAGEVRSQSTRRTSNTHKSAATRRSSVSTPKSPAPRSEYSEHEKEIRHERAWSGGRRQPEYETYQYVNAPSGYDRRASRGSFGYRSSNERQIVQREYWK